jgi:hypothetical protein
MQKVSLTKYQARILKTLQTKKTARLVYSEFSAKYSLVVGNGHFNQTWTTVRRDAAYAVIPLLKKVKYPGVYLAEEYVANAKTQPSRAN